MQNMRLTVSRHLRHLQCSQYGGCLLSR